MVLLFTACPYSLDYLCRVQESPLIFLKKNIIPLCWYNLGSINDIMELPIGLVNRLGLCMQDEKMKKSFRIMRGDTNVR